MYIVSVHTQQHDQSCTHYENAFVIEPWRGWTSGRGSWMGCTAQPWPGNHVIEPWRGWAGHSVEVHGWDAQLNLGQVIML